MVRPSAFDACDSVLLPVRASSRGWGGGGRSAVEHEPASGRVSSKQNKPTRARGEGGRGAVLFFFFFFVDPLEIMIGGIRLGGCMWTFRWVSFSCVVFVEIPYFRVALLLGDLPFVSHNVSLFFFYFRSVVCRFHSYFARAFCFAARSSLFPRRVRKISGTVRAPIHPSPLQWSGSAPVR